ncbi:hypothetical protein RYH80_13225 [Halobaculum sp. MBLA0147]|uniref:hypothetical protein n=1 Tax=Halobaculum sp. MBLA0147 TaxID=3079934 RepID=UPI00352622B2
MQNSATKADTARSSIKWFSVIVAFLANIVLAVGVASTGVDWVPQPSMNTIEIAFGVTLFAVGLIALRLLIFLIVIGIANPVVALGSVVFLVAIGVPGLFVMYTAVTTVWETLPARYAVRTSFLFLLGSLFSGSIVGDEYS